MTATAPPPFALLAPAAVPSPNVEFVMVTRVLPLVRLVGRISTAPPLLSAVFPKKRSWSIVTATLPVSRTAPPAGVPVAFPLRKVRLRSVRSISSDPGAFPEMILFRWAASNEAPEPAPWSVNANGPALGATV